MQTEAEWRPSKFVEHRGGWRASRDRRQVSLASRFSADLAVAAYQRALADHARGDMLDLGCGLVPLYGVYRGLVSSVTCADWANTMHPSPHLDLEADLNEPLPFADASFDTILLTDVLEHLPYPDRLFGELGRVLRPGGKVIVGVPFYYWIHEQPHDHHRYTEFRLRRFCEDHGLAAEECFPTGGGRDVVVDALSKYLVTRRKAFRPMAVVPGLLARRNVARAQRPTLMPLGYVLVGAKPHP